MKKVLALLLCLCMVFALCACGGTPADTDKPAEDPAPSDNTASNNGATTIADANKDADIYSWIVNEDTSISGTEEPLASDDRSRMREGRDGRHDRGVQRDVSEH